MNKKFAEDLVIEVRKDYERRAEERRQFEAQWQLNTNFVFGNQYCRIGVRGEIEESERDYYWQEREVFNHIATIVETRIAKLARVKPKMSVLPASNDDNDLKAAAVSGKILASACSKLALSELISKATMWSELTGTAFYKLGWDASGGKKVGTTEDGKPVYEGEITLEVCPPYEIFPSSLTAADIDECRSIIHAKAVCVDDIKRVWGKAVKPESAEVISLSGFGMVGGMGTVGAISALGRQKSSDSAVVIERYSMPSTEHPEGELAIVAGDQLLYYGPLPFAIGEDGRYALPFVKQTALSRAGCFFGTSMVERAIPVQRAYNAVKNRKHEFLNRIAMGVLTVEDGSVDTDNLESEGLSPGKILVYRQGSAAPRLMSPGSVPADFTVEEQRLLDEFVDVSGISEIMRSSSVPGTVTSGAAIQMLVEQDDTRLSVTAESIRTAIKRIAKGILRLYRGFASAPRLDRFVGEEGKTELLSWSASTLTCDDVVFDTENEINSTAAARQGVMMELLRSGLLADETGKISDETRYKALEVFGYGGWERTQSVKKMHLTRAEKENLALNKQDIEVSEVDDHALHESEHIKFFLSSEFERLCAKSPALKEKMLEHIRSHRALSRAHAEIKGDN